MTYLPTVQTWLELPDFWDYRLQAAKNQNIPTSEKKPLWTISGKSVFHLFVTAEIFLQRFEHIVMVYIICYGCNKLYCITFCVSIWELYKLVFLLLRFHGWQVWIMPLLVSIFISSASVGKCSPIDKTPNTKSTLPQNTKPTTPLPSTPISDETLALTILFPISGCRSTTSGSHLSLQLNQPSHHSRDIIKCRENTTWSPTL